MKHDYALFDKVSTGILIVDSDYNILFWNKVLENWSGKSRFEMTGKKIYDFFDKFKEDRIRDRLNHVFKFGAPVIFSSQLHQYMIPAPLPNGNNRLQHTVVTAINNKPGVYNAIFSIQDVTDITEKAKQYKAVSRNLSTKNSELEEARERLLKSEFNFRQMIEFISDAVVVIQNKKFVFYNKSFLDLLDLDHQSIKMSDFEEIQPSVSQVKFDVINRLVKTMSVYEIQMDLLDSHQKIHNLDVQFRKFDYEGQEAVLAIMKDITEKMELMAMLEQKDDQQENSEKMISMCASCHRVKNKKSDHFQWSSIEEYLKNITGKNISHGICNDCFQQEYPEYYEKFINKHRQVSRRENNKNNKKS